MAWIVPGARVPRRGGVWLRPGDTIDAPMLLAVRLVMLLLGLAVAGLAVTGIVALVRRRWARGFWFGLGASAGGIGCYVLVGILGFVVYTKVRAGWYLPVEGGAEVLADTISNLMAFAAAGLVAVPAGMVIAVVGAVGWLKKRERTTEG